MFASRVGHGNLLPFYVDRLVHWYNEKIHISRHLAGGQLIHLSLPGSHSPTAQYILAGFQGTHFPALLASSRTQRVISTRFSSRVVVKREGYGCVAYPGDVDRTVAMWIPSNVGTGCVDLVKLSNSC